MNQNNESDQAEKIIAILTNSAIPKKEVLTLIENLPLSISPSLRTKLAKVMSNESIEDWRRLEAYKLLIYRGIAYPVAFKAFVEATIEAINLDQSQIVDMTMAQLLPVDRTKGDVTFMVTLPIRTPEGPVALYFVIQRLANVVTEAKVFPDTLEIDE
jgi:hypothetical protein